MVYLCSTCTAPTGLPTDGSPYAKHWRVGRIRVILRLSQQGTWSEGLQAVCVWTGGEAGGHV